MNTIEKIQRIDDLQDELKRLQNQVAQEQRTCQHVWGETKSDPIITPDMQYSHLEGHGSDPHPVYKRVGDKREPRWSRKCTKCGKKEYTKKQKTVKTEPDFGK